MPPAIGSLSYIAAGTARHENFHARLAILFKQQRFQSTRGGSFGSDQTGGACANHNDLIRCGLIGSVCA